MTTETQVKKSDKEKKRMADAVAGAIFLIGLGILIITGWWWPGIMVVIGLSSGASLIFRDRIAAGISSLIFFCGIAVISLIVQNTDVDGVVIAGMILVGIGIIILVKAFVLRE